MIVHLYQYGEDVRECPFFGKETLKTLSGHSSHEIGGRFRIARSKLALSILLLKLRRSSYFGQNLSYRVERRMLMVTVAGSPSARKP